MERKLNIVPGEAPESDDEENTCFVRGPKVPKRVPLQGSVIAGEAPESDTSSTSSQVEEAEEVVPKEESAASRVGALSSSPKDNVGRGSVHHSLSPKEEKYSSLLHKKLRERNASLRRSVEDFVHHTVESTARDLNSIDQQLLKSQVTLQEAVTAMRLLQSNLSQINSKLTVATSTTYLPYINIEAL